ncbi:MAG: outer membrane protein TolC [Zhongshania sp.]|jgi:outer membrane protein TolC
MRVLVALGLLASTPLVFAQEPASELSLNSAIAAAIASDPWLNGSRHRENALSSESVSAASLPDPKISLTAGNFPVDTLDINQEAMTQLAVAVSQTFPRGDSLSLSSRQKRELAAEEPMLRLDREAKVAATVTQLWLEKFKAQESIRLIERDRSLFEQLVDAARASYSSALGRARQQDLIRAQLELARIDDRLTVLQQQQETTQRRLSEWIGVRGHLPLAPLLPNDALLLAVSAVSVPVSSARSRYELISLHPLLQAFDQRINAMQTGVELVRQKYQPEWGLTAQYGYRDDDSLGRHRADLFSIGVSVDMPLFTANRQDKDVSAAVSRAEAIKTDKQLLSRQLMASLEMAIVQLQRLNQRLALYENQLLPQMALQAEAALTAYDSDDGDFAEAVRARIAQLNAKIEALVITVEQQQTIVKINYLLSGSSVAIHTPAIKVGDEYEANF